MIKSHTLRVYEIGTGIYDYQEVSIEQHQGREFICVSVVLLVQRFVERGRVCDAMHWREEEIRTLQAEYSKQSNKLLFFCLGWKMNEQCH